MLVGLGLFAGASLLAGLALTGWALLAGRVLQGLSAAVLSPSALSLVVRMFDGPERDRALGIWSALGGAGAALGLLLGIAHRRPGLAAGCSSSTCPSASCSGSACAGSCRPTRSARSPGRLDLLGAALAGGHRTLLYALIQAGDRGWTSAATGALAATAVALYLLRAAGGAPPTC